MVMADVRFEGYSGGITKIMHDVDLLRHFRFLLYCALVSASVSFYINYEAFSVKISSMSLISVVLSAMVGFGVSAVVLVYGPFVTGMKCGYCRRSIGGSQEGYCHECEEKYHFSIVAGEAKKQVDKNYKEWEEREEEKRHRDALGQS